MNKLFIGSLLLIVNNLFAQEIENPTQLAQPVVAEGKILYRLEMASWIGTDLLMKSVVDKQNIGRYFSYLENDVAVCIFCTAGEQPKVLASFSFANDYKPSNAVQKFTKRELTTFEKDILNLRKEAEEILVSDTTIQGYEGIQFNLIPIITETERKVYVLSASEENGVVIFGNDYLLQFDQNNHWVSTKSLHQNIMPTFFEEDLQNNKKLEGGIHSHSAETGDFITATDICTLMLYQNLAGFKNYTVVSEKYMNLWDCTTNQLTVIERKILENSKPGKKSKRKD